MLENPLDPRYGAIAAASAAIGALALKLVDRVFQVRDRRDRETVDTLTIIPAPMPPTLVYRHRQRRARLVAV